MAYPGPDARNAPLNHPRFSISAITPFGNFGNLPPPPPPRPIPNWRGLEACQPRSSQIGVGLSDQTRIGVGFGLQIYQITNFARSPIFVAPTRG
jgi:hypothetical protein